MDIALFGKSMALGLAIAAPFGPMGALCVNRALERGFWAGVASGLGTALADAFYASLAALGFAAFSAALGVVDGPLRLFGGVFMIWLGWKSLQAAPAANAARVGARALAGTVSATFLLTVTNPMTILSFAAIFAGLGLAGEGDGAGVATVVAGVFLGSLGWWFALSGGVSLAHRRLPPGFAVWTARISGAILILFGVGAIGSLLWGLIRT
ncbi:LysE family transporter [Kaustia mangrovi]|uniref:LysE family transporter n=1 Tax=Kaustia mangrovi TaxID=2593653 RepID=A0A7S8C8A1_9HYPH|nr:LysE family transporter [Kaustia mangrovi]QPC45202.1 LysE family transporter [Kaustia mangrovi]